MTRLLLRSTLLFAAITLVYAADPPQAQIANQQIRVKMYTPDATNAFYKGARFDPAGIVNAVEYKGHTFYGPWFTRFDPSVADFAYQENDIAVGPASSSMGPTEEFSTPQGFDAAKPGEHFIKIGVGILKKGDDPAARYSWRNTYPVVDRGKWTVKQTGTSITFTQELSDPVTGYAYVYTKTLRVEGEQPQLVIEHSLKNTGKLPIDSSLYDHNFMIFDHQPTGDITVTTPYTIAAPAAGGRGGPDPKFAAIEGKQFKYVKTLVDQERASGGLAGFGATAADYDFKIENHKTGTGIRIQGDRPLTNASVWSIRSVMAVEPFIKIAAEPGKDFTWTYRYTYYTLP